MEKFLVKDCIGDFFSKFYKENAGKNIEARLDHKANRIEIYNRDKGQFTYVELIDERPTIDSLVKSLSE